MKHQLLFILLVFLCNYALNAQTIADVEKIKKKLYGLSLAAVSEDTAAPIKTAGLINTMDPAGKWPDISYQNKSAARWLPADHWKRLLVMSQDYRNEKSNFYGSPLLRDAILKGVGFWNKETPIASNYWWNAIGVPGIMGKVLILMENDLSDSLKVNGVRLLKVGVKPDHYEYYGKATGQNLLWIASAHLYAACLTNDVEGVKRVFASVAGEIIITEGEGIQPDYSFYQHGKQNYAMGYGKGFSATAVQFFYLASQTAFRFPLEKVDIISHYLLDGQQWMTRYDYLEYTAMGRELSRNGIDRSPILGALKWMADIDTARRSDYLAFYRRLSGIKEEAPLVGNRYFWRSDLMVHQRKNYYFSLKATSDRITSGESGNGENIKGFYQGNGTYYIIRNGHEYDEIFPAWNWLKLPGLLARQSADTFPLFTWGAGAEGATSFVYGISDSLYGCFAYDFDKAGVTAHRSWFFFDNEIVHLVNSVTGDSVYQSINQCLLKGEVWTNKSQAKDFGNSQMVFHDSVGYCISSNGSGVELNKDKQTGSWKSINLSGSAEPVSKDIFSLGISLGARVSNGAFSYTILPGISLDEFKKYRLSDHIHIIENTNAIQAVYQQDIEQVQGVFFNMASMELPWDKLIFRMKRPGLVLIKKINNKLFIDYCQPSQKKHTELVFDSKTKWQNADFSIVTSL